MANYLYNGVELPDINECWTDKETYPYAVITKIDYSQYGVDASLFSLHLASLPLSYDKVNDNVAWIRDTDGDGGYTESELALVLKYGSGSLFPEQRDIDNLAAAMGESADGLSPGVWLDFSYSETAVANEYLCNGSAIWTSHDILNTDGSIYLAASEPIPVGGEPEKPTTDSSLDPTSMLMGWLVGRAVASQRGKT